MTEDELSRKLDDKLQKEAETVPLPELKFKISEADIYKSVTSQQDGDAWLFYQIYKDQLCFDHAAGRWYVWHNHYWKEDEIEDAVRKLDAVINIYSAEASKWSFKALEASQKGEMKDVTHAEKKAKEYLKKISTLQKKRWKQDVLELAADGEHSLAITGKEWDNAPYLLPCVNGVIELITGNFRPGKQSDFIKTVCPTEWKGLDAPCPIWERFLNEIFDGDNELISFLQRLCGYAVAGITIKHVLPIFHGQNGRNGKGTFFDAIYHTLGPLSGPIQSEMLLDQGRFRSSSGPSPDIMSLKGKRIIWGSETDEGRKFNSGKVKWLVGGDILCGREPYGKRDVSFKPTHTLFLLTNNKPKADPNDKALWHRIHLIPFTKSYVESPDPLKPNEKKQDPMLPAKIKMEASGILAWLVRGFLEWQKHDLMPPRIVKDATDKYQENEDIIGHFLDDCCILGGDKKVKAGDLYKAYVTWCQENGHKPISGTKMGERMKERFEWEKTNYVYYFGIGLLNATPF